MKRALITGITGQDGSYLSEFLLQKGYEVHGIVRRTSNLIRNRTDKIKSLIHLHYGDMCDASSLNKIIEEVEPDEIYNLAAQSHVGISFKIPEYTADVNALGVIRLLEAIRHINPKIKLYQASTSEMFGTIKGFANESTPFSANSPYAASKLFAHEICNIYREAYGLFICCGIMFNHESPRRGENFVTRKIAQGIVRISQGLESELFLGNLDAKRDWGYAPDYVEAMWLMLQQDEPDDYVVATAQTHSVREFVEEACKCLKLKISWCGEGKEEVGIIEDKCAGIPYMGAVEVSEEYYRPFEVPYLKGDYRKFEMKTGWNPKTTFKELVKLMIGSEMNALYT